MEHLQTFAKTSAHGFGRRASAPRSKAAEVTPLFFRDQSQSLDSFLIRSPKVAAARLAPFPRLEFIGINFHKTTMSPLIDRLLEASGSSTFRYLVTPNVDHLVTIEQSGAGSRIRKAYEHADLQVCDSRVLSLMAKRSGLTLPAVPGSDVTKELLSHLPVGTSVAVVGGDNGIHTALRKKYRHLVWTFMTPPMGVLHSRQHQNDIADFVARCGADVCLFAFGSPQSEIVCSMIQEKAQARGVALCIGASLEFITGRKKRAPVWMQKANCEWLFRLLSEPQRLAHRYLVKGPQIFGLWLRWRRAQAQ